MKTIFNLARILLGIIFIVFGLNGLYTFIPVPEFHPFMALMVDSGFIYVVKIVEVLSGILLITNRFTLIGLLLLGPVIFNILLYHLFLDPRNAFIAYLNLVLYVIIATGYWPYFRKLLIPKPKVQHFGK